MTDGSGLPRQAPSLFGQTGPEALDTPNELTPLLSIPHPAASPALLSPPLLETQVEELIPSLSFLVVDDVRCSCEVFCSLLRSLGAKPAKLFSATTLFGAMNLIRSHKIDVVVSDLHLRVGSGLNLLETIRSTVPSRQTSFMLTTNDPSAEDIRSAQRMGVTAVVVKPISIAKILEHLAYCLAGR